MDYDPMSPIWLQVVNRIKGSIATGAIEPGGKLPGGRDMAVQYSINPNTAAREPVCIPVQLITGETMSAPRV